MNRLLWYVFAGSRGGPTRIRIARALLEEPRNMNQLAQLLGLDYKTVEYDLRVLLKHRLVTCPDAGRYGARFEPSKNLRAQIADFESIAADLRAQEARIGTPTRAPHLGKPRNTVQPNEESR